MQFLDSAFPCRKSAKQLRFCKMNAKQNGGNGMGFFDFRKGKKGASLGSPVKGECVPIQEVADPTFADEVLGKGAALKPADGRVYAPVDGKISTLFPTGHAVGIVSSDGAEILIHVGLDTVQLKGRHFKVAVQADQQVKKGDLLLEADLEEIRAAGYDTVIPVILCNSDEFSDIKCKTEGSVEVGEEVISYRK